MICQAKLRERGPRRGPLEATSVEKQYKLTEPPPQRFRSGMAGRETRCVVGQGGYHVCSARSLESISQATHVGRRVRAWDGTELMRNKWYRSTRLETCAPMCTRPKGRRKRPALEAEGFGRVWPASGSGHAAKWVGIGARGWKQERWNWKCSR